MGYKKGLASVWAVIITMVIMLGLAGGAYYYFNQKFDKEKKDLQAQIDDLNKQVADLKKATTSSSTTPAASSTTTTDQWAYKNTDYGFSLTFNSKWSGYKLKPATIEGITATFYINVPTADSGASESSTNYSGMVSPFAISVFTKEQWAATEALGGPMDQKITENDKYVFSWSQANGVMPDDVVAKGIIKDIENIIATFKLN